MTRVVVCTPLRSEYLALRGRVPSATIVRTGMGRARSLANGCRSTPGRPALLVAGLAGALQGGLRTGDVVVATEVRGPNGASVAIGEHAGLAAALRRCALTVHEGAIVTTPRLEGTQALATLAATGALAVDLESFHLVTASSALEFAVVRVIVDTPDAPLRRPGTIVRGIRALSRLRAAAPAIEAWAATYDASRHHPQPTTKEVI